jgi:hypothetical protein
MQMRLCFGRWPGKVSRALPAAEETNNKKEKKTMAMTMLTRRDDLGVASDPFDSIKWALETHVKRQDSGRYNYAVLYGNEDSPDRIDFWCSEPDVGDSPRLIWRSSERQSFHEARRIGLSR